jgi:hypothetical protein
VVRCWAKRSESTPTGLIRARVDEVLKVICTNDLLTGVDGCEHSMFIIKPPQLSATIVTYIGSVQSVVTIVVTARDKQAP